MANELTEYYRFPKPDPTALIRDEVAVLQQAFDMIDAVLNTLALVVEGKSASGHGHPMSAIVGLADALAGKMASTRTFTLAELTDVVGAADALNNYIMTKLDGTYVFRSALSVLGAHGHAVADITGLQAILNTLAAGAASATDGHIAVFDGTSGKALKSGGVALAALQALLVSGTNIKSLGGQSLLGSGNLTPANIGAAVAGALASCGITSTAQTLAGRETGSGNLASIAVAPAYKIVGGVLKPNIEVTAKLSPGVHTGGLYSPLTNPVTVTLVTGTEALLTMSCVASRVTGTGAGFNGLMSYAVSGATVVAADDAHAAIINFTAGGLGHTMAATRKITGLTPGSNTFTLHFGSNGQNVSYGDAVLSVQAL